MDARGYNKYKEQTINSMTSGELLLLLYDELVKRSTLAHISLQKEEYPVFEDAVTRCIDIVKYLDETLDRSYPISRELARMYEYFIYTLGRIKIGRNQQLLDHIRPMLSELRDTFKQAEKESSSGRSQQPVPQAEPLQEASGVEGGQ